MQPLVFEPYFRPLLWGGRRLADRLGKPLPAAGQFGESWEISGHRQHVSRVAEGPLRGKSLTDLWHGNGIELLGRPVAADAPFPLLIKYLDCRELLSVQVHPDDAAAARLLPGELGKTEAWIVLDAAPEGRVYAGLKPGVDRAELERALDAGTVADCLHGFAPRPGDCVFLPAGTVHAVGGGVLMAEVQQSSDATFRLFDWNRVGADGRPRPLHRREALASIDWARGPVEPMRGAATSQRLAACAYFVLNCFRLAAELPSPYAGQMSIWMVLPNGEGRHAAELAQPSTGYRRTLLAGDTVLVPAAAGEVVWRPTNADAGPTLLAITLP